MRGAPGLLAQAVRAGLAHPAEVLVGRTWLEATPRSNIVHRLVQGGQPVAYSKQRGAASWLDGDDPVAHERRVLPALAALRCVPALLPLSDEQCVWTSAVPGLPLPQTWGDRGAMLARCRAFGAVVGALHAHPVPPGAPAAPQPWALTPDRLPPSMQGAAELPAFAAVREALEDPEIRTVLDDRADRWSTTTWIHGDLGPANVLVHEVLDDDAPVGGDATDLAGPRVWLVDLESAGVGDPGWDLAVALDTMSLAAAAWGLAAGEAFAAFGPAYRAAGGPAMPDAAWRCTQALTRAWRVAASAATAAGDPAAAPDDPISAAWEDAARPDGQVAALLAQARAAARRARRGADLPGGRS